MITKTFVGLKQQLIVIKSNHWNCQIIADKIFNVFNVKGEIKQLQGIDNITPQNSSIQEPYKSLIEEQMVK